jgi:hypothetical protein
MKRTLVWILAALITLAAAYYQRKTGPTYPIRISVSLNDTIYKLKLIRSIEIGGRSEVKLSIRDTSVKAILYFKRFRTNDDYMKSVFSYKVYPVHSFLMNKVFKMTEDAGLFADVPTQPPAGKLQYYIEIAGHNGTQTIMKETPVIIRFKDIVPGYILIPHILLMFIAMLFSTTTGLMSIFKVPEYRKYGIWTLVLLTAGGIILGPVVQKYAFGDLWTGFPFGLDITDNKTLIAFIFRLFAVIMNYKKERPVYMAIASAVLLLVYSIPHSLFGSEFDYANAQVIQGALLAFFYIKQKKFLN